MKTLPEAQTLTRIMVDIGQGEDIVLGAKVGDRVKAGDTLFTIAPTTLRGYTPPNRDYWRHTAGPEATFSRRC